MIRLVQAVGASNLIGPMSVIPPTGVLFAAFLGYNPVNTILDAVPQSVIDNISPETIKVLTDTTWFPTTLAQAFMPSLRLSFYIGAILSIVAAFLSAMRGPVHADEIHETAHGIPPEKRNQ